MKAAIKTKVKHTETERFPVEWESHILFNLAEWVNGLAFRQINFSSKGRPVIKINELKYGITPQTKFTEQEFDRDYFLTKGDMLFSWSGSPETSIDAFWYVLEDGWLNQHIFKVRPSPKVDRVFFFYLLRYLKPLFIDIARNKQTTGLGHVTMNDLKHIDVRIPTSREEQRTIVRILYCLDSKIEINQQMNATLEAIAKAVFKHWFIDFEFPNEENKPYRSSGGEMTHNEKFDEKVPKEWKFGHLGDFAVNPRRGVQPAAVQRGTPYIGLEHMPRNSIGLSEWGTAEEASSNKFKFFQGEILFGKLRPYFHKVGIAPTDGVCSTDILVIAPKSPEWQGFLLGHVSTHEFVNYTDAASTGTRMPRTNWEEMALYELLIPTNGVARAFNERIGPLIQRIRANVLQNRTLGGIRDSLLPKLISGKIRVPVEAH